MKSINSVLVFVMLSVIFLTPAVAQKRFADGDRVSRGGNRLISAKSEPGRQLHRSGKKFTKKTITADAEMSEADWQDAQTISQFVDSTGKKEETIVNVLFDQDNIYLFWAVHEEGEITADVKEEDTVITGDDYVQINLKPWLPDDIKYARDYYYSIAVNPIGTVWDSYFDPYLGGYFYSSWDSNIQVVTSQEGNQWLAEIIIPFSGLDHSSDPGWKWNLDFWHVSRIAGEDKKVYTPETGITVEQGIMVRRKNLVDYYWTRPEFMMEVKPGKHQEKTNSVRAAVIDKAPAMNGKSDADLWSDAETIEIKHTDRMGQLLNANTARAKVAATTDHLCFNLEADGAKTELGLDVEEATGQSMGAQMKGVNGVYVDTALLANECFWVILQPRKADADNIHQPHYLIKISSNGHIDGTKYDQFGAPDRSWQPKAQIDTYNTAVGWGAEVNVAMSSFDLPAGCTKTWGFNIFRNRMLSKESKQKSELQAWAFTATDFLNPDTLGTLTNVIIDGAKAIRPGFERKVADMKKKIDSHTQKHEKLTKKLSKQLGKVKLKTLDDLPAAEQTLEQVDNTLGVIDTKEYYNAFPHPAKGGYALLDVQFIGNKGWAVGAMGTILRSEDGGKTWQSVDIATDVDLYRVFFVNKLEGWTAGGRIRMAPTNDQMRHDQCGGYGYIFHTTDGGKTWQCQYGQRGRHLFGLYFTDENTGYACGERGVLLKTEDGGVHWKQYPTTGTRRWLYGITFKDKINGFIVGESETVLKTTDGGKSWAKLNTPADRQFYGFRVFYRDITFNGPTGCIVGQNGSVLISDDAGQTWQPTATFVDPKVREFLDFTSVHFVTPKIGYVVGELGTRIMLTEDAGKSWTLRPVENTDWLRALWADANGKIVLVGEREKVLISNDKGFNWDTIRSDKPKADVLILTAHGDDSPIRLGSLMVHYGINEEKQMVDIEVIRDAHSVEYHGEIYNLEHHRDIRMSGVRTTTYFDEFENGNNGCDYYNLTTKLWEGEENAARHIVAAIRAYRPDIVITHEPVYGEYDKPGHKLSGRAGLQAFDTSGGQPDRWPRLTRLGLTPWQAKKFYCLAGESYPPTIDIRPIQKIPLKGTEGTCWDYAQYVMCVFQSQGIHRVVDGELCLVRSLVSVPGKETSIFDGL
jgi:photosystem II stability/assembly factor-like uncharacterized protein